MAVARDACDACYLGRSTLPATLPGEDRGSRCHHRFGYVDASTVPISVLLHRSQRRRDYSRSPVHHGGFDLCSKMTGKEILHKAKACFGSSSSDTTGKEKSKVGMQICHGSHLIKGKSRHAMEDYVVAQFKKMDDNELGLFAIFDGHMGHKVPDYLQSNLFDNMINQPDFWTNTESAIRKAYDLTDCRILDKEKHFGIGGSTAVTAILINSERLVVANVGDSRAVICRKGMADQLSIDHEPISEREAVESKGGFVSRFPGDVPRVDGQLAVSRAFGDPTLKEHLSSEPDVVDVVIDSEVEFLILASDGVWGVMSNQEAVDAIKQMKDAELAAKHLTEEALARGSTDDISCIVVSFQ